MKNPIDAVITWVDGSDPAHKQKMQPFLSNQARISDDIAGPTRYRSQGEIFYCVASIYRFAPFIRKIFIVTDEQDPELEVFIKKNFPDSPISIEIVDHRIIFKGYEQYLPVFSSRAVETCIHRIPDLSEHYVYFNDDFFLIRPVDKRDWFFDDKIIAYGNWRNMLPDRLLWHVKPKRHGHKPVGFKDGMICAARNVGYRWKYFHLDHSPHPVKKGIIAKIYSENPQLFLSNISYKFRNGNQFNTFELYYLEMLKDQKAVIKPASKHLLYMKPVNRGPSYIPRKMKTFTGRPSIKFGCIGSIDMATEKDRTTLFNWLKKTLNITF